MDLQWAEDQLLKIFSQILEYFNHPKTILS